MKKEYQHKNLAAGRWFELTLVEQMGNIGSEVGRSMNWREKGNEDYAMQAFWRAMELFDLTKCDPKNRYRLKEVCRSKECFADYFIGDNQYLFTKDFWDRYFNAFGIAANKIRIRNRK